MCAAQLRVYGPTSDFREDVERGDGVTQKDLAASY